MPVCEVMVVSWLGCYALIDLKLRIKLLKIGFLKFPLTWQNLCSNATPNLLGMPGNFFLKITRGLKPRHCRPFLLSHSLRKLTYLPPTSSKIQMYDTFFLLERIETCGLDFSPQPDNKVQISPPPLDMDDHHMLVGQGGMLKL